MVEYPDTRPRPEPGPIPMLLWCPACRARHIDEGEFATKVHHTHACQTCGMVWRPALVPTVGVQYLPGFKNAPVTDYTCKVSAGCTYPRTHSGPCSVVNLRSEVAGG